MQVTKRVTSIPAVYLILSRQQSANNGKEILMSLRSNTGYRDGFWSFPAGHIEPAESLTEAMVREAQEELGISVRSADLKLVHSMWRATPEAEGGRLDFYFNAVNWIGEPVNAEPEKCGQVSWWPIDRLPTPLIPEVAQAIDAIENASPYSEIYS